MTAYPQKITFGEIRESGVREVSSIGAIIATATNKLPLSEPDQPGGRTPSTHQTKSPSPAAT